MILPSCTNETLEQNEVAVTAGTRQKTTGDNIYDILGYGYDITQAYNTGGERKPILDMSQLATRPYEITEVQNINNLATCFNYGSDAIEYSSKTAFNENTFTLYGMSEELNSSFLTNYIYYPKYSYASVFLNFMNKSLGIHSEADVLKNYLTPEFKQAIDNLPFDQLISQYGTHLITNIYLGSKLSIDMQTISTSSEKAKSALEKLIDSANKFFTATNTISVINSPLASMTKESSFSIRTMGGKFSVNTKNINDSTIISWLNSRESAKPQFIGIKDNGIIPIYEFVSDPTRKEELKNYITNNYIPSKNLVLDPYTHIMDATRVLDTFSDQNQGGGIAIGDINKNGIQDLIFMGIDNPSGANNLRFRYLFDVDATGISKKEPGYFMTKSYGYENIGGGVGVTDIDKNGKPDLIVTIQDKNTKTGNPFYYKVFYNVNSSGVPESSTEFLKLGSLTKANCNGANMCIADVNKNGIPDLLYVTYEDPKKSNYCKYQIAFDIQPNGTFNHLSGIYTVSGAGYNGEGCAIAAADIDNNGKLDIVLSVIDAPKGANYLTYKIIQDINSDGGFNNTTDFKTARQLGNDNCGAGLLLYDFDSDSHLDLMFMAMDASAGTNYYWYNIAYNIKKDCAYTKWY